MSVREIYGYIRVSTAKQGEQGVSLQEQKGAIEAYARRHELQVVRWFEEQQTAAKRGRPMFNEMLGLLMRGKASGVAIHKIDRGARNLKDWADLGELIDRGINVYFANESLDLQSRSGRLSADIQAVVAADYIRNLREETRKGFYGRLKQGLYPLPAPLGYRDLGKGKAKEIDPTKGPLVRTAFELYATGRYPLKSLVREMRTRGLANRNGKPVTLTGYSRMLNNPFYIGIIRLTRTGETFQGNHETLIPKAVFDRVQAVLRGRTAARPAKHDFLFRRLLRCAACGYSLIGEIQKGHVYYRCHTQSCRTTAVREEPAEAAFIRAFEAIRFTDEEQAYLAGRIAHLNSSWTDDRKKQVRSIELQLISLKDRLNRLADALVDGLVDRGTYEDRKSAVVHQQRDLEETLDRLKTAGSMTDQLTEILELANTASLSYRLGNSDDKRELIQTITSNRSLSGKNLVLEPVEPFRRIAERLRNTNGDPYRGDPRTLDALLGTLVKIITQGRYVLSGLETEDPAPDPGPEDPAKDPILLLPAPTSHLLLSSG